jgi:hypothetical protein
MTFMKALHLAYDLQTIGCRKLCLCSLVYNSICLLEGTISSLWPGGPRPEKCTKEYWVALMQYWGWHPWVYNQEGALE